MLNGFKLSPPEVAIAKSQPNYKFHLENAAKQNNSTFY